MAVIRESVQCLLKRIEFQEKFRQGMNEEVIRIRSIRFTVWTMFVGITFSNDLTSIRLKMAFQTNECANNMVNRMPISHKIMHQ